MVKAGTGPLSSASTRRSSAAPMSSGSSPTRTRSFRPVGAVLFEQNDEWQSEHRYMQVEAFAQIDAAESDPLLSITTRAA
jgi:hypothetical protein